MARIVIVGGGLGGATLALLLAARTTHDITVIEQAPLAAGTLPDTPSYDARSTALALGSAEILAALGAWDALRTFAAPIHHIEVSHQGRFGAARLDAREENVAALGFVAENRAIGYALLQALRATRIDLRAPMRVEALTRDGDGWRVGLADGAVLAADLLVVAEGAQSVTRRALGIATEEHDYGADAIVCNVTPRTPHGDVAYERFTGDGAVAILPLTGQRCAIVWSQPRGHARERLAGDEASFLAALSQACGQRLGGFMKVGERVAYPLIQVTAGAQAVPGAVLLGNAAHLLHPVAGQGFNLTLRDAVALADTLAVAERDRLPPGDLDLLNGYVARRARDQQLTAGISHGLPKLFTTQVPLLPVARDLGLVAFDLVAPLKREFARQAMGIGVFTGGTSRAG